MIDRELEDYERIHLLDSMYIEEMMRDLEREYYEYARRSERDYIVGRKRKHKTNAARNWVRRCKKGTSEC